MYKLLLPFTLIFLVLTACNPDKHKKVDQTSISFKTNDASKLFFKNLRQTYYEKEEMIAAKMDVYRFKDRNTDEKYPVINLAIVNNWRFDEAYLILEPNSLISLSKLSVYWKNIKEGTTGTINFANGNKETIVSFADKIYEQIQQSSEFSVKIAGKDMDILKNSEDRETFRVTMVDYYRLVQRL